MRTKNVKCVHKLSLDRVRIFFRHNPIVRVANF